MQTTVRDAAGLTSIVTFSGELDVYGSPRAKEALLTLLERGRRFIVVNLERVTYVDTTGLGVLVDILRRARTAGGSLFVVTNAAPTWKLFKSLGLVDALALCDDEGHAVAVSTAMQQAAAV